MASSPSIEAPATQSGSLDGDAGEREESQKSPQRGVCLSLPQDYLLKFICHASITFTRKYLCLKATPWSREPVEKMEAWTLGDVSRTSSFHHTSKLVHSWPLVRSALSGVALHACYQ